MKAAGRLRKRLRIAMFPETGTNPYLVRLRAALEAEGVEFVSGRGPFLSWRWLIGHAGGSVVVYLHWLSPQYTVQRAPRPFRVAAFVAKLLAARLLGYRIVWTCHNLFPHEFCRGPRLHLLVRRACCRLAERIIVHSEGSRRLLQRHFGCGAKAVFAPHGHFAGVHGEPIPRRAAREALGIEPEEFLYAFLGRIRPYKGIERLLSAFSAVSDPNSRLLIAGRADPDYGEAVRRALPDDPRVELRLGWLPDEKVVEWLCAADVLVFPFREVLNSGSVILAMSYGALCIVPRSGSVPEILPEDAAVYFTGEGEAALVAALRRARCLPADEAQAMRRRAQEAALALRWQEAARRIVEALR